MHMPCTVRVKSDPLSKKTFTIFNCFLSSSFFIFLLTARAEKLFRPENRLFHHTRRRAFTILHICHNRDAYHGSGNTCLPPLYNL
jgi:hypothetical protein